MTDPPILSIVTVTYENVDGLRETLNSIAIQAADISKCEILVIDGGSADGSVQLLHGTELAGLSWKSESDNGVYHAMNKGIAKSRGDYLMFLNAGDTLARPDSLSKILERLSSKPNWLIVGARNLGGPTGPSNAIANVPHNWFRHAMGVQPHCHQACIFSAELTAILGGYSEEFDFVGDFDFILRAGLVSRPEEDDTILVDYEGGGQSAKQSEKIPLLLHKVRASRFQLSGVLLLLDRALVEFQVARRKVYRLRKRNRREPGCL